MRIHLFDPATRMLQTAPGADHPVAADAIESIDDPEELATHVHEYAVSRGLIAPNDTVALFS